jgi:hypothetical protein
MVNVSPFYKICTSKEPKTEFELQNLGDWVTRGMDTAIIYDDGSIKGGGFFGSAPTAEDYDMAFSQLLLSMKPVYRIEECLDYHFNKWKNSP